MKRVITKCIGVLIISIITVPLSAQQPASQKKSQQQAPAQPTQSAQAALKLANSADSSQYILGAYLGQFLQNNNLAITNATLFLRGMDDVISNKPLMVNADSIPRKMNEYTARMNRERNQLLEKQLFEKIKGQPGVGMLPNGVCYVISKPGTGERPVLTDSVQLHVKGYLPVGTVFEDTYSRNNPIRTIPGKLIPGMREALQIMPAGSVWRIFIPSALAYGENGIQGAIPPYSAIVFDVELIRVYR
ncbi:MAG TPA: FKBP-type peptidyl-prolyl cis-trans isomerase [Bacteroidales bacterium]|nr:FKBP-type peptidyl-prolyl cis-trans isomerase [Bacteroidales bacterium]